MAQAFGIDIGGSGIKGAVVDLSSGQFQTDQLLIPTPQPSTPEAVTDACAKMLAHYSVTDDMPVGITFPAPVKNDTVRFIANLDQSWTGVNVRDFMKERIGRTVTAVNDADAAGFAEAVLGAAQTVDGLVIVTTLGTGIGTAFIYNGVLIPNTELGHIKLHGDSAEKYAAASVKSNQNLSWEEWTDRLQEYYSLLDMLFSPDLFVVGGGVSENAEKFLPHLNLSCPIVPAKLRNTAGIVGGAALAAKHAGIEF